MYTKGRWEIQTPYDYTEDIIIVNEKGTKSIAVVHNHVKTSSQPVNATGETQANAKRICRCVNNFDALFEACKWAARGAAHHPACKANKGHKCDCFVGACVAAISHAEKE